MKIDGGRARSKTTEKKRAERTVGGWVGGKKEKKNERQRKIECLQHLLCGRDTQRKEETETRKKIKKKRFIFVRCGFVIVRQCVL